MSVCLMLMPRICFLFLPNCRPTTASLQEEVLADIKQDKVYLQGQDKHGRGVCILQGRKHTYTDATSQPRFITYVIDGIIASCDLQRNPDARIVAVFELQSECGPACRPEACPEGLPGCLGLQANWGASAQAVLGPSSLKTRSSAALPLLAA
jgi:hypothetical protein